MAQELQLYDLSTKHQPGGSGTNSGDTEQSGRRLLRIGILTLGVLCIIQATLNISLRLALNSREDIDQFPFNSSIIAELCQIDQSQQNSSQLCSCCNQLLRRLLKKCEGLEKKKDIVTDLVTQQNRSKTEEDTNPSDLVSGSGSGSPEGYLDLD